VSCPGSLGCAGGSGGGKALAEVVDLAAEVVEAGEEFLVLAVGGGGLLALDEEAAAGFENATLDLLEVRESLAVGHGQEFPSVRSSLARAAWWILPWSMSTVGVPSSI